MKKEIYLVLLLLLLVVDNTYTQCTNSYFQLEVEYSNSGTSYNGDAIRLIDASTSAIIYCKDFDAQNFKDTVCIKGNTSVNIYGYDNVGENWGEAMVILKYLNDPDDCGPTMDSILIDLFPAINGVGEMICGAPISNDILIGSFTSPNVYCSGSEPQCFQDTIHLTTEPGDSTITVNFLDYVTDDGDLTFDFAIDAEYDIQLDSLHNYNCGGLYPVLLGVSDDDGNSVSCELVFDVTCGTYCDNTVLHFDGIDDKISVRSPLNGNSDFTIAMNVNWSGDSTGYYARLIGWTDFELELALRPNGELSFYDGVWKNSNIALDKDAWYNVCLRRENADYALFLDGTKIFETTGNQNLDFRDSMIIGGVYNLSSTSECFSGMMDEVRVYSIALVDSIIGNGYQNANNVPAFFTFEEGTPNGNNTMIVGATDLFGIYLGKFINFNLFGGQSNYVCQENLDSCEVDINYSSNCNVVNLSSNISGFVNEDSISYSWSSPNTNFEASVLDTTWIYTGILEEVILCLEVTDGNCIASKCDTIAVSLPKAPIMEGCVGMISTPYLENCEALLDFPIPFAKDPCTNDELPVTCSRSDGQDLSSPFPIGETQVICTASSNGGLTACTTTIEILDETPPECISSTLTFYLDENGVDTIYFSDITPASVDECGQVFFTNPNSFRAVDCFGLGGSSYLVQDENGNETTCFFIYDFVDTFPPKCIVQDQFFSASVGKDSVQVYYSYEVEDNCINPMVTFSIPDGSIFKCGSRQEVVMRVEDNYGNRDSCEFIVQIDECFDYFGKASGKLYEDIDCDGRFDNDEGILSNFSVGLYSDLSLNLITSTVSDSAGYYCFDSIPVGGYSIRPIFEGGDYQYMLGGNYYPFDVDTFIHFDSLDFALSYTGPATDFAINNDCFFSGDTIKISWKGDLCNGDCFLQFNRFTCNSNNPIQTINSNPNQGYFEYVVGNVSSVTGSKFLLAFCDTSVIFDCIDLYPRELDFTAELVGCKEFGFTASSSGFDEYIWSFGDGERGNFGASTTHVYTANEQYEVCLKARALSGCEIEVCKAILVEGECDDCNVVFSSEGDDCYGFYGTSVIENYELNVNYQWFVDDVFVSEGNNVYVDLNGPGTYEICLIAQDGVCSDQFCRTIIKDTIYPNIFCPNMDLSLYIDEDCSPVYYTPNAVLGDFCHKGDANVPDIIYSRSDGLEISAPLSLGATTYVSSFTDLYGVTASCSIDVELMDSIGPTCRLNPLINLGLDQDGLATVEPFMVDNGSFDNCGEVELTLGKSQFNCNDIGEQEVTVTLSDGINETTCLTTIRIEDNLSPTCTLEETDIWVDENGDFEISANTINYSVFDNCGNPTIEFTGIEDIVCNVFKSFDIGLIVTDAGGNIQECSSIVNLNDSIPPDCVPVSFDVYLTPQNMDEFVLVDNDITQYPDNCGINNGRLESILYNCDNVGSNTIIQRVTDHRGNSTSCDLIVNIHDRIPPICDIADMEVQATEEDGAVVNFEGTASDPCGDDIVISYSMPSGDFYPCGEYTITMTATDEHGNSSSCDFNLKVSDCDGCCLSESDFMEITNEGFEVTSILEDGTECIVQLYPPELTDCQVVSQVIWGDGTIMNGQFPSSLDFIHQYANSGDYTLCITMEESNTGSCFSNQVCRTITVDSNCGITSLLENKTTDVIFYPVPVKDILHIKSVFGVVNRVDIIDVNGREYPIEFSDKKIDVSLLQSGVYFVRLEIDSQVYIRRIVKMD